MWRFRSDSSGAGRARARLLLSVLAVLLLVLGCGSVAVAAESGGKSDLGERIHQRFRVTVEEEAIRLSPIEGDRAIRSITLADDETEASVNGKAFSAEELRAFLGKDGELIAELAALNAEARRSALGLATEGEAAPAEVGGGANPPPPPLAPIPPIPGHGHFRIEASGDDRVSFGRSIEIGRGESAGDAVCIGCSITVAGEVKGDAVAVGGSIRLESGARVHGDTVSVGGKVQLEPGASVGGDAVAVGGTVQVAEGATVAGQRSNVGWGNGLGGHRHGRFNFGWPTWFESDFGDFFSGLLRTLFLALLCCVAVLLARSSVEHTSRRLTDEPWKAIFAGLLTELLFLPVLILVTVILAVSIIGIPLLILVPVAVLAFLVAMLLGFAAVAQSLGRWAAGRFGWKLTEPYLPVVVGVGMIQGLTLVARLIGWPGGVFGIFAAVLVAFGFFVKYAAWTMGLGAMTLSLVGRDWRRPDSGRAMPGAPTSSAAMAPAAAVIAAAPPPPPPPPLPQSPSSQSPSAEMPDDESTKA